MLQLCFNRGVAFANKNINGVFLLTSSLFGIENMGTTPLTRKNNESII